jgi:hypothetical protein
VGIGLFRHRGRQGEEALQSLGQAFGLDRDLPRLGDSRDVTKATACGGGVVASASSTGSIDGSPARSCHCPASSTTSVSPSRRVASVAVAGAVEADVRMATSHPLHDAADIAKRWSSVATIWLPARRP